MTHYIVPAWFFGIDIALELVFFIITLAVAIASYKIYRISREKSMQCFSASFFLISLSYLVWALINTFALSNLQEFPEKFSLQEILSISAMGFYMHILLLTVGFVTLVYAVLPKKSLRVYYLLLGLGLTAIVANTDKVITFRIVSVFLLSSIVYHFFVQWREHNNKNLLYTFVAFILLSFGNIEFALSESYYSAYVIGHLFELAAYLIILSNLVKITFIQKTPSNEQKKNKT